jgi:hypothetical protein
MISPCYSERISLLGERLRLRRSKTCGFRLPQRYLTYFTQTLTEAAALGLVSYTPKVCNLRIVSVNGATVPTTPSRFGLRPSTRLTVVYPQLNERLHLRRPNDCGFQRHKSLHDKLI